MHFGHWNFFALMRAKIPLSQKRLSKNCGIVKIVSMKVIQEVSTARDMYTVNDR